MNKIVLAVCDDLNAYLMERYSYKTKPASIGLSFTISANRKYFDIYLRCPATIDFWPKMTLVVARIKFKNIRNREGSDLLTLLVNSALDLGLIYIAIEESNLNSALFAESLGFKKYKSENNWLVKASKLKLSLNS